MFTNTFERTKWVNQGIMKSGSHMLSKEIEIAPNTTVRHWLELREKLTPGNAHAWEAAIEILKQRIESRYLKPIGEIQKLRHSGFAVMTLACMLIDALQSFHEAPARPSRSTAALYRSFFRSSPYFKKAFRSRDLIDSFYYEVRCALLHDGQTRGHWVIRADTSELLSTKDKKRIINRKQFQNCLVSAFEDYLQELRHGQNNELRRIFRMRMDIICGETPSLESRNGCFYFAYGSNMCTHRLLRRIGTADPLGAAKLEDYALRLNKHSLSGTDMANIQATLGKKVFGVLYDIEQKGFSQLREEWEKGYEPIMFRIQVAGREVEAHSFIASKSCNRKCPISETYADLFCGANEHQLPASYIDDLLQLLAARVSRA